MTQSVFKGLIELPQAEIELLLEIGSFLLHLGREQQAQKLIDGIQALLSLKKDNIVSSINSQRSQSSYCLSSTKATCLHKISELP